MRRTLLVIAVVAVPAYAGAQTQPEPGAPTAPAPEAAPPARLAEPPAAPPLAGNWGGVFYLRDADDNFRLHVQGRAQVDSYNYFGPGVADTSLKSTILLRRIRPELSGEFLRDWQWMLAGDWGSTSVDNAAGTNEVYAAGVGKAPTATSGQYASAQTPSVKAAPTDVYINYRAHPLLNLQAGQYNAPFMLENRTSDKYTPFMERSLAVRDLGIPTNKEMGLMAWGETSDKMLFYAVGIFDGDGQNRGNVDNRFDGIGSIAVRPLSGEKGAIRNLQIGASARYGMRDSSYVNYDIASMTTQGNYTFFSPVYAGSAGRAHVIPSGAQVGFAGELRVPVEDFDLTGEFVSVKYRTREGLEGSPVSTLRRGELHGYAYYAQLGWWPLGNRDIIGIPGGYASTHVDFKKPNPVTPPQALQLLVKWEQLVATYDGAGREGTPDPKSPLDGDTKVNAISLGANYWATKHVRLTVNYVYNMFPGSAPAAAQTRDQRAQAPANKLAAGINDSARTDAHDFHELLFRAAVAF